MEVCSLYTVTSTHASLPPIFEKSYSIHFENWFWLNQCKQDSRLSDMICCDYINFVLNSCVYCEVTDCLIFLACLVFHMPINNSAQTLLKRYRTSFTIIHYVGRLPAPFFFPWRHHPWSPPYILWAEMCPPPKFICLNPNTQYPRMWPYLEIGSLRR